MPGSAAFLKSPLVATGRHGWVVTMLRQAQAAYRGCAQRAQRRQSLSRPARGDSGIRSRALLFRPAQQAVPRARRRAGRVPLLGPGAREASACRIGQVSGLAVCTYTRRSGIRPRPQGGVLMRSLRLRIPESSAVCYEYARVPATNVAHYWSKRAITHPPPYGSPTRPIALANIHASIYVALVESCRLTPTPVFIIFMRAEPFRKRPAGRMYGLNA